MNISNNILYLLLKIFKSLLLIFPKSFISNICQTITKIVGSFCHKENKIIKTQLQTALNPDLEFVNTFPSKNYAHLGRLIAETFFLKDLVTKDSQGNFLYVSSTNDQIVKQLIENKQGVLALSGHIGCFELLAAYYIAFGVNMSVVARKPNYDFLGNFVGELRSSYGVQTIWREDPDSMKKLLTSFRNGNIVAALIDQDTALESEFAPFFGIDAASPSGLINYAVKKEIKILSSFIVRAADNKHKIYTENIPYDKEDPNVVKNILTLFNQRLEEIIRKYPDQWIWWHRRWRRRANIDYTKNPELLPSTKDYLNWLLTQKK